MTRDFAISEEDLRFLKELEDELQTALLGAVPREKIVEYLRGVTADDVLRYFPPEAILRQYKAEDILRGLSEKELRRLRELLEC
jgi:hypothetical protein